VPAVLRIGVAPLCQPGERGLAVIPLYPHYLVCMDPAVIKGWLDAMGVKAVDDPHPLAAWRFKFKFPSENIGRPLSIYQRPEDKAFAVVVITTVVSEAHRERIRSLTADGFREFRFDMQKGVLMSGRAQYGMEFDAEKRDLAEFTIVRRLWDDAGACPRILFEVCQGVFDMTMLCTIKIKNVAGEVA
jgi:hypothetical protein